MSRAEDFVDDVEDFVRELIQSSEYRDLSVSIERDSRGKFKSIAVRAGKPRRVRKKVEVMMYEWRRVK